VASYFGLRLELFAFILESLIFISPFPALISVAVAILDSILLFSEVVLMIPIRSTDTSNLFPFLPNLEFFHQLCKLDWLLH
jgi:hypothetical protein